MKQQSITSLPPSPEADRHSRMVKYSLAMGIRMVCIVAVLFVDGWWLLVPALGAVFLPYFAVLIANTSGVAGRGVVERPGAIVLRDPNLPGSGFPRQPAPDQPAPGPGGSVPGDGGDGHKAGTP